MTRRGDSRWGPQTPRRLPRRRRRPRRRGGGGAPGRRRRRCWPPRGPARLPSRSRSGAPYEASPRKRARRAARRTARRTAKGRRRHPTQGPSKKASGIRARRTTSKTSKATTRAETPTCPPRRPRPSKETGRLLGGPEGRGVDPPPPRPRGLLLVDGWPCRACPPGMSWIDQRSSSGCCPSPRTWPLSEGTSSLK